MGHKTRWQARMEGMDGRTEEVERQTRNIKRARLVAAEVEDENKVIEQRLGLRVR